MKKQKEPVEISGPNQDQNPPYFLMFCCFVIWNKRSTERRCNNGSIITFTCTPKISSRVMFVKRYVNMCIIPCDVLGNKGQHVLKEFLQSVCAIIYKCRLNLDKCMAPILNSVLLR